VKRLICSATAIALMGSTGLGLAADLPYRKAPVYVPPPAMAWRGFYFGANAGGRFGGDNSVNTSAATSYYVVDSTYFLNNAGNPNGAYWANNSALGATNNTGVGGRDGFLGGAQIGYNYQLSSSFVTGIETDIQGIASQNSSGSATNSLGLPLFWVYSPGGFDTLKTTISSSKDIDYFGTVRGRFGYLVTPSLLAYGTGVSLMPRFIPAPRLRRRTTIRQTPWQHTAPANSMRTRLR
jgi:outer membrane immunogenic protein